MIAATTKRGFYSKVNVAPSVWSKFMTQFLGRQFPNTDLVTIPSASNKSAQSITVALWKKEICTEKTTMTTKLAQTWKCEYLRGWKLIVLCPCLSLITLTSFDPLSHRSRANFAQNIFASKTQSIHTDTYWYTLTPPSKVDFASIIFVFWQIPTIA